MRCYEEHVGEHIQIPSLPPPAFKENKSRHLESIGCMKFLFTKEFNTMFRLGNTPCKERTTCSMLGHIFILNK
jgi:hypothetical protein